MRPDFFDRHSRLDSPVHRLSAAKLATALVVVVAVALSGNGLADVDGVAVLLMIVAFVSRIPRGFLLKRLLWLEPVVFGVAVLSLLQPHGGVKFITLVTKSTLCVFTMILLSNTTPFSEMLSVLRRLRVPALLITTFALMYRYLFVLIDETHRMRQARASRTFTRRRTHLWHALGTVIGQLFVRSCERAERIYAAMCARGWR